MGQPVVHWEFWSKEPEKLSEFYSKIFGWNIQHIPAMNYHMVQTGGTGGINGGIMKPKEGPWPSNLTFYIEVDDVEGYAKKVAAAGCKVIIEKMDVPGVGTMSMFLDPDNRPIGLWKKAPGL